LKKKHWVLKKSIDRFFRADLAFSFPDTRLFENTPVYWHLQPFLRLLLPLPVFSDFLCRLKQLLCKDNANFSHTRESLIFYNMRTMQTFALCVQKKTSKKLSQQVKKKVTLH